MANHVYNVTEIVGTSPDGVDAHLHGPDATVAAFSHGAAMRVYTALRILLFLASQGVCDGVWLHVARKANLQAT